MQGDAGEGETGVTTVACAAPMAAKLMTNPQNADNAVLAKLAADDSYFMITSKFAGFPRQNIVYCIKQTCTHHRGIEYRPETPLPVCNALKWHRTITHNELFPNARSFRAHTSSPIETSSLLHATMSQGAGNPEMSFQQNFVKIP
jgi:hypothetical protein